MGTKPSGCRRCARNEPWRAAPGWPASMSSLYFLYGRGRCLYLEFASVDLPECVWAYERRCNGAPCGSRSGSGRRCLRAGHVVSGVLFQRVQRQALVVVQRRNAAGGLAPCDGESLRGVSPSHVAGPGARFLFRIIPSYTKRSARAGNAVDVGTGGRLRPAVRPGRSLRVLRSWKLRSSAADADPDTCTKPVLNPGT